MIQGATIRRPKPQRTIADATTRLASQNQIGRERAMATDSARTREALAAKPDLVEEARDLRRLLAFRADADVRRGGRDLAEHLVSPIVGERRETSTSQPPINIQSRRSSM